MLIDTHCHINMMVKKKFDVPMTVGEFSVASTIINNALKNDVTTIINVGTSLVESENCVALAKTFEPCFAAIGIHPNDCTTEWYDDLKKMRALWFENNNPREEHKIVAIGEIGLDKHYPGFDIKRQIDAFKAQTELALEYNLPIIIHTRDAQDQTLRVIEEYLKDGLRGEFHCFSETMDFAQEAIKIGFKLGIGGTLTYPKNEALREIFKTVPLSSILLETDAPFLPPQAWRGTQNTPAHIKPIAEYLAELRGISFEEVARITTENAKKLFAL